MAFVNPASAVIVGAVDSHHLLGLYPGCPITVGNYCALDHAVELRRADLASLLIRHAADVREVDMSLVLEMWDPDIVELFLSNGASLYEGNPVALALMGKMRPALGILKRYPDDVRIQKQGSMALRHHASEGNQKWVALLLWAGADPWDRGPYRPEEMEFEVEQEEEYSNAMELAAYQGSLEPFCLKRMSSALSSNPQAAAALLSPACSSRKSDLLAWLLDHGYRPDLLEDRGNLAICRVLQSLSVEFPRAFEPSFARARAGISSSEAMEQMKMIHMLVANGARWAPEDQHQMMSARRSLLMMAADYVVEFVWIMQRYQACRRKDIETLLGTPAMRKLVASEQKRLDEWVAAVPTTVG